MAHVSWPVLAALLRDVPDAWRAVVGALFGVTAAAPSLLLLVPTLRRRALGATLWWLLAAAVCILLALPLRGGGLEIAADFRRQVGWYVPAAAAGFVLTAVLTLRRIPADAALPLRTRLVGRPGASRRRLSR